MKVTYEPEANTLIFDACSEAIRIANQAGEPIEFDFNGITLIAMPFSNPNTLAEVYHRKMQRRERENDKPAVKFERRKLLGLILWFLIPIATAHSSLHYAWGLEVKRLWLFIGINLFQSVLLIFISREAFGNKPK